MGRPRRFKITGHLHHVTGRFLNYFLAKQDDNPAAFPGLCESLCEMFMAAVEEAKNKFGFALGAFVLMGNHYHLMIGTRPNAPEGQISDILHAIHSVFAHRYNREMGRRGQVFLERFSSPVVENIRHAVNAITYIHENPSRSQMEAPADTWKYSSFQAHASKGERGWYRHLVDRNLSKFGLYGMKNLTGKKLWKMLRKSFQGLLGDLSSWRKERHCALVIGCKLFRYEVTLAVGMTPVKIGPWRVVPGP